MRRQRTPVALTSPPAAQPAASLLPAAPPQPTIPPRLLALVPYITGPLAKGAAGSPTRVGTWIYDVLNLTNGATTGYAHGLGRIPNGFIPIRYSANIQIWFTSADVAAFTATSAQWHGSGSGTVAGFWV